MPIIVHPRWKPRVWALKTRQQKRVVTLVIYLLGSVAGHFATRPLLQIPKNYFMNRMEQIYKHEEDASRRGERHIGIGMYWQAPKKPTRWSYGPKRVKRVEKFIYDFSVESSLQMIRASRNAAILEDLQDHPYAPAAIGALFAGLVYALYGGYGRRHSPWRKISLNEKRRRYRLVLADYLGRCFGLENLSRFVRKKVPPKSEFKPILIPWNRFNETGMIEIFEKVFKAKTKKTLRQAIGELTMQFERIANAAQHSLSMEFKNASYFTVEERGIMLYYPRPKAKP